MKLMDEVHQKNPKADLRWSVIHAYMPIEPKTNMLADMAKSHIIAVANPPFQWQQGDGFATNAGPARMARIQPFRSYLKAGVLMPSGSDYPIVTHDPWVGIYALLTRRDQKTGKVYGPNETIGIVDALRSYSTMGAYLTYDEKKRGSIEVGKLADLTVLDLADINMLEKNPELCFQMRDRVVATLVGGQIRYQKSPTW
jgi:predicted amidohydrolase YtcJ